MRNCLKHLCVLIRFSTLLFHRLLDVSVVSVGSTLDLTLVLEYIDQDLSTYLSKVPASGLSRPVIKVGTLLFNLNAAALEWM